MSDKLLDVAQGQINEVPQKGHWIYDSPAGKKHIAAKLLAVAKAVSWVEKRGKNETQKYEYVMAADVAAELRGHLYEQGVIVTSSVGSPRTNEYESSQGKKLRITTVDVRWTFIDVESGEEISVHVPGEAMDAGDKAVYKAMTGSLKYAMMMNFLLPTGDDPEKDSSADEAAYKSSGKAPAAAPSAPAPRAAGTPQKAAPAAPRASGEGITIPFGKHKGKRLGEPPADDLIWLKGAVEKSVDDPAKANFKEKNLALLNAIEAELDLRAKMAEGETNGSEETFPTE